VGDGTAEPLPVGSGDDDAASDGAGDGLATARDPAVCPSALRTRSFAPAGVTVGDAIGPGVPRAIVTAYPASCGNGTDVNFEER